MMAAIAMRKPLNLEDLPILAKRVSSGSAFHNKKPRPSVGAADEAEFLKRKSQMTRTAKVTPATAFWTRPSSNQ